MNIKKFLREKVSVITIIFTLLLSVTFSLGIPANALAYSGTDYTSNGLISSRLNTVFSNYQPGSSQFTSSFDNASQCYGYAMYVQSVLFGKTEKGTIYNSNGNSINYETAYPGATYSIAWSALPTGTHIRGKSPYGSDHSIILLKTTASNITYIDANGDGQNTCNVVLHDMAWSTFFQYYVSSITYASYPSSATYPISETPNPVALVSGGTYVIQNVATGNYANVWADSSAQIANSTRVTTYPICNETTQYFTLYQQSDGSYIIMPYSTGYAIDCTYRTNGSLNTYDPNSDLETWYISPCGTEFKVQLKNNATMYWTAGASTYANITLAAGTNNNYQVWRFVRIY